MAEMNFDFEQVTIDESKIIELSIAANEDIQKQDDGKYSLTANYNIAPIRSSDSLVILELSVEISSNGAPTYDVKVKTRTGFSFPKGSDEDSQYEYLKTIGAARAFDFIRSYVKMVTSFGLWGTFDIPGLSVSDR